MFIKHLARLTLALALNAATALADDKEAREAPPPAAEDSVPPPTVPVPAPPEGATKEDRELWAAGAAVASRIGLVRLAANKMQWEARSARTLARLEEASKRDGEPAAKAASLLGRYRKAIAHNHETMTRRWPVDPTRGCGYAAQVFHSAAEAQGQARSERALQRSREDLQECIARAEPAIRLMAASNEELKKVVAEVDALLGPAAGAPRAAARQGDLAAEPGATAGTRGPK